MLGKIITTIRKDEFPVYICGPMYGIEDYNYPLFNIVERELKMAGIESINPTTGLDEPPEGSEREFFTKNLLRLINFARSVVVIPGFEKSYNGGIEIQVAKSMGMRVFKYPKLDVLKGFGCVLLDARLAALRPFSEEIDGIKSVSTFMGSVLLLAKHQEIRSAKR